MSPEPSWCAHTDHGESADLHRSRYLRVGERRDRGEVGVYLEQGGDGPTRVAVNVAQMTFATAELSLEQAQELRDNLDRLLRTAARRHRNER